MFNYDLIHTVGTMYPPARVGHTVVECRGLLYMFGGFVMGRGLMNDMWTYNTSANLWVELTSSGEQRWDGEQQPEPR